MKCCGEYVLISSENMFCDKCNKVYTLFEEDIITSKTYQNFEDYNIKTMNIIYIKNIFQGIISL